MKWPHTSKSNESAYPHKDLYANVPSGLINDRQKSDMKPPLGTFQGDGNVSCLNWGVGYRSVYIYQGIKLYASVWCISQNERFIFKIIINLRINKEKVF